MDFVCEIKKSRRTWVTRADGGRPKAGACEFPTFQWSSYCGKHTDTDQLQLRLMYKYKKDCQAKFLKIINFFWGKIK
jgi:hypothetical protein